MTGETQDGLKAAVLGAVECVNKSLLGRAHPIRGRKEYSTTFQKAGTPGSFAANLMFTFRQPPAHVRAQIIVARGEETGLPPPRGAYEKMDSGRY